MSTTPLLSLIMEENAEFGVGEFKIIYDLGNT